MDRGLARAPAFAGLGVVQHQLFGLADAPAFARLRELRVHLADAPRGSSPITVSRTRS